MRIKDCAPEDSDSVAEGETKGFSLMKETFHDRRLLIQNEAATVADILDQRSALDCPVVVSILVYSVYTNIMICYCVFRLSRKWDQLRE